MNDKLSGAAGIIDETVDKVAGAVQSGELGEMVENAAGVVENAAGTVVEEIERLTAMAHISSGVIVAALILLCILLFRKPIKLAVKIALNTGIGFVALLLVNYIGTEIGVSLGVNWLNALVVGVLGIPGVALLFFIKWMMLI